LLGSDDDSDMAGSAAAVENPSLWAEVEVLGVGWLPFVADVAVSFPGSVGGSSVVLGVQSFVGDGVDEVEVLDSVVLFVLVAVVDLEPVGDRSMLLLPDPVVDEPESPVEVGSVVALGGGVSEPGRVAAFWPPLTDCC
jgi:hypothetical protein